MAVALQGVVTSDKRDKTITVSITSRETHPLYRKQYSHTRKYAAHDENNEARVGDRVEIVACRPFSKTVSYNLSKIIERSHGSVELKNDTESVIKDSEHSKGNIKMTEQGNESKESSLSLPNDADRTDFDSEGGKR